MQKTEDGLLRTRQEKMHPLAEFAMRGLWLHAFYLKQTHVVFFVHDKKKFFFFHGKPNMFNPIGRIDFGAIILKSLTLILCP